jgi:hypothetical protein
MYSVNFLLACAFSHARAMFIAAEHQEVTPAVRPRSNARKLPPYRYQYRNILQEAWTEGQFSELTSEAVYGKDQGGQHRLCLCHV